MSVEDTIKDCINYLNEDVCNKSFLTYEEEREWEDYITRLINNSNKEKDKEIEKLNNIINELEKRLEEEIERTEKLIQDDYEHGLGSFGNIRKMLNEDRKSWLYKIKELRGEE